eukprot:CAMPEP_0184724296 /NCGR_PEP_ID=MMETSP0314-20130426/27534_2 /TAXON_ID=38298 /ORGANISM="Rhodella maculata, Strain CCMP 736" /LENGTH=288 /DNA_ID=CAMNT_0027189263 /DNA_START=34 /DNA_END=897 /DNA_ORIENTATION=-
MTVASLIANSQRSFAHPNDPSSQEKFPPSHLPLRQFQRPPRRVPPCDPPKHHAFQQRIPRQPIPPMHPRADLSRREQPLRGNVTISGDDLGGGGNADAAVRVVDRGGDEGEPERGVGGEGRGEGRGVGEVGFAEGVGGVGGGLKVGGDGGGEYGVGDAVGFAGGCGGVVAGHQALLGVERNRGAPELLHHLLGHHHKRRLPHRAHSTPFLITALLRVPRRFPISPPPLQKPANIKPVPQNRRRQPIPRRQLVLKPPSLRVHQHRPRPSQRLRRQKHLHGPRRLRVHKP